MIEPTESETKVTLDDFAIAMYDINANIENNPEALTMAPFKTPVRKLDETKANRQPDLRWTGKGSGTS